MIDKRRPNVFKFMSQAAEPAAEEPAVEAVPEPEAEPAAELAAEPVSFVLCCFDSSLV
jgi:hypothetical protein